MEELDPAETERNRYYYCHSLALTKEQEYLAMLHFAVSHYLVDGMLVEEPRL